MKINWKAVVSIIPFVISTLACAASGVDSFLNPLPNDDFSNSGSGWGTGTDPRSSVEYVHGGLQMIVYQPYFVTWSTPNITSYDNIHIETTLKNDSTDPQSFFGIICNEQGSTQSYYYVGVSPDGHYAFIKSAVAKEDEVLKKGNSDVIKDNVSAMRLGLDCGGGNLTLYVNGQKIDSVSDSTYTSGAVGLFAASDDQSAGANVTFDNFVATKLGE